MSLGGLILGIIDIGIVVAVLLLLGLLIVWVMGMFGTQPTGQMRRIYLVIVALIALAMLVRLIITGLVPFHLIG